MRRSGIECPGREDETLGGEKVMKKGRWDTKIRIKRN
jgi:hypothetical protein